jgi:hypothetical protein
MEAKFGGDRESSVSVATMATFDVRSRVLERSLPAKFRLPDVLSGLRRTRPNAAPKRRRRAWRPSESTRRGLRAKKGPPRRSRRPRFLDLERSIDSFWLVENFPVVWWPGFEPLRDVCRRDAGIQNRCRLVAARSRFHPVAVWEQHDPQAHARAEDSPIRSWSSERRGRVARPPDRGPSKLHRA